jgi:hypothetical protein
MFDGFRRRRTRPGGGPRRRLDGMLRSLGFQQVTVAFSRAAG